VFSYTYENNYFFLGTLVIIFIILKKKWSSGAMWSLSVFIWD